MSWLDGISREALFVILVAVIFSPIAVRIIFAIGNRNRDKEKQVLIDLDKKISDLTVHINELKVLLESQKNKSDVIYVDNRIQEDISFVPTSETDVVNLVKKPNVKEKDGAEIYRKKSDGSNAGKKNHVSKAEKKNETQAQVNKKTPSIVVDEKKSTMHDIKSIGQEKTENKGISVNSGKKITPIEVDGFGSPGKLGEFIAQTNSMTNKDKPQVATGQKINENNASPFMLSDKFSKVGAEKPLGSAIINSNKNDVPESISQKIDDDDEYLKKVLHNIK